MAFGIKQFAAACLGAVAMMLCCACAESEAAEKPEEQQPAVSAQVIKEPEMEPVPEIRAGVSAEKGDPGASQQIFDELYHAESVSVEKASDPAEEEEEARKEEQSLNEEGVFTSEEIPDAVFARMQGLSFPEGCTVPREDLRYLRLSYYDFTGTARVGEMVCGKKIAGDLVDIFRELYARKYQIDKMRLIDDYNADDDLSCASNNTSCFCFRTVAGSTNLSKHAMGLAVDINPFYNPYVTYPNGVERISPPGSEPYADRSADFFHKIGPGDDAYELFKAHGFTWGGDWKSLKDYQHFQKP